MTDVRHEQNSQKFQQRLDRLKSDQMRECTFKPSVGKYHPVATGLSQYDITQEDDCEMLNYW